MNKKEMNNRIWILPLGRCDVAIVKFHAVL